MGVSGVLALNSSAVLDVAVLASIRHVRDFTEGPSLLYPIIQGANRVSVGEDGLSGSISRLWLDNVTTTTLSFETENGEGSIELRDDELYFDEGTYVFTASYNYPQLDQLSPVEVLRPSSQDLIQQNSTEVDSLSFLSYTSKLLAGGWRFLTYFGRDTMISLLLSQYIYSEGENGAIEAVISGVLERTNRTDGSTCHEETIGDYATWLNLQNNITSTAPQYDYKMIDTDFFLPVVMDRYFVATEVGQSRRNEYLSLVASVNPDNAGLTYEQLALATMLKIMNITAPFAQEGGQTEENLIHLKEDQIVGQWRDSTYGIGGGRIPFDVNTALVPAALRAIASLSEAGFFPGYPNWQCLATEYADIWENNTISFFQVRTTPAR